MTTQTSRQTWRKQKLKWYLLGPIACLVSLPVLIYACALLVAKEVLPFELLEELVIACVFLSGTFGGLAACAARGGKVMQTGLTVGAILAGGIVIATLVMPGEGVLNAQCLRHVIAALAGGAFGGALSIKHKRGDKRRRKRK